MKKFITTILALVYMLGGCTAADFKSNTSNDSSEEISIEASEAVSSEESADSNSEISEESKAESNDSSESSDSSEESFEDVSSEESREEEPSSQPDSSEEEKNEDPSSSPVESEPEEDESKVEDVSSAPVESEPEKDESKGDVPVTHTHSYTATVKAATCTAEGYTEYKCECGDSYKADYTAKTEHQWGPWFISKDATTTEDGSRERGCTICYDWEYETLPMIVVTITQEDLDMMAEVALEYLNERRAENGLPPLVTGPIAHQMASERAVQLSEHFSHELPNGYIGSWEVYAKYKYNPESLDGDYMPEDGGENIARSKQGGSAAFVNKDNDLRVTARGMISGFEMSAGHWGDLMAECYTACGIGIYVEKVDACNYNIFICVLTMDKLYGTDANQ